jgi:hypothetical protein
MNSEWFLFKGTHHIGPFSSKEIEEMYKRGEIKNTILVWKEGEVNWEPMIKVSAFKYLFNPEKHIENQNAAAVNPAAAKQNTIQVPPQLPGISKKLPANLNTKNIPQTISDDDIPPPLPLDVFIKPSLGDENISESVSESVKVSGPESEKPIQSIKINKTFSKNTIDSTKWTLIGILLSFVAVVVWFIMFQSTAEIHFKIKNLMPIYTEKLEANAMKLSMVPTVAMALGMDGQTLYFSTNSSKELDVAIQLTTISGRILGNNEGKLLLRGKALDHFGEFRKMYFTNGSDFSPGEYLYEVHLTEMHFINSYFPALGGWGIIKKLNKKYTIKGKTLISASSPREFEAKLLKFKQDEITKKTKPYLDTIERLKTLNSIIEQLLNKMHDIAMENKSTFDVRKFEDYNQKDISPLLQNLISDQNQIKSKNNDFIKDISAATYNLTSKFRALKKITADDRNLLLSIYRRDLESTKTKINKEIINVNNELNQMPKD